VPQFKLFLSTNNKPVIKGNDHAIWRRIKLVPFPVQLPEAEWDRELPEKLKAEAFGILAWLVRGCRNWLSQGLDAPVDVTEATRAYRAEMDVLQDFLEDRCLINPQIDVSAHDIYKAYQDWAEAEGMSEREIMKQRTFGICLGERGFVKVKSTAGIRLWRGLGLLSSMK
jgi:putative DNA primase/helicase